MLYCKKHEEFDSNCDECFETMLNLIWFVDLNSNQNDKDAP